MAQVAADAMNLLNPSRVNLTIRGGIVRLNEVVNVANMNLSAAELRDILPTMRLDDNYVRMLAERQERGDDLSYLEQVLLDHFGPNLAHPIHRVDRDRERERLQQAIESWNEAREARLPEEQMGATTLICLSLMKR